MWGTTKQVIKNDGVLCTTRLLVEGIARTGFVSPLEPHSALHQMPYESLSYRNPPSVWYMIDFGMLQNLPPIAHLVAHEKSYYHTQSCNPRPYHCTPYTQYYYFNLQEPKCSCARIGNTNVQH